MSHYQEQEALRKELSCKVRTGTNCNANDQVLACNWFIKLVTFITFFIIIRDNVIYIKFIQRLYLKFI